jgi:hypothetical protein
MDKWLNLKVYLAGKIEIRCCIQDRQTLIRGESATLPAAITVDPSTGGLRIYMTHSYFEDDPTLDYLLNPLSSNLGMDPRRDSLQVRMLGAILMVHDAGRITEIFDMNGIPKKGSCSDDDDYDWLAEAKAGLYSNAWGSLREADVLRFQVLTPADTDSFDRSSWMKPNGKTRRKWDWPAATDGGASNTIFSVIAPGGPAKTDFDPWEEDPDDDEHLKYLGELEVGCATFDDAGNADVNPAGCAHDGEDTRLRICS